jgi:hypothetical protein
LYTEEFQASAGKDRERPFWQLTRHAVGITSQQFWNQKVDDPHYHPCRKELVLQPEDWCFSSAHYWLTGTKNDVQLSDVG